MVKSIKRRKVIHGGLGFLFFRFIARQNHLSFVPFLLLIHDAGILFTLLFFLWAGIFMN